MLCGAFIVCPSPSFFAYTTLRQIDRRRKIFFTQRLDYPKIETEAMKEMAALRRSQEIGMQFIATLMEENSIGFNEFSRKTGVSASHLFAIIKGKSSPSLATLSKMAARFGKNVSLGLN